MISRRRFLEGAGIVTASTATGVAGYRFVRSDGSSIPAPTTQPPVEAGATTPTTAAAAGAVPTTTEPTTEAASEPATFAAVEDRILVIVQMNGGNDALNTVVPTDGRYRDARPNLAVPEADLLPLAGVDDYYLHPSMAALTPLWSAGQLAVVNSVGYENQSRSHFEAMDWWFTATEGDPSASGWLGRWLDLTRANGDDNPMRGISLGGGAPALRAVETLSTTVRVPRFFQFRPPPGTDENAMIEAYLAMAAVPSDNAYIAAAQAAQVATAEAVELFAIAADGVEFEGRPSVGQGLDIAANLISQDLGTRIVIVSTGGFDTHANQLGTHDDLLLGVADGVASFLATIEELGMSDRVLVMTTSEFGRRVAENGSGGTDHGSAGTQFLAGAPVAGAMHGTVDLANLDRGDLVPRIDVRSLYQAALSWLGGPVDEVLYSNYEDLGILVPEAVAA